MLNLRSLTEMVKQALEDYDPELYFELQDDGSLERVAEQQAEAAFETRAELMNQANRGVSDLEASPRWSGYATLHEEPTGGRGGDRHKRQSFLLSGNQFAIPLWIEPSSLHPAPLFKIISRNFAVEL